LKRKNEANYFQVVSSDIVLNNLILLNFIIEDSVFDRGFSIRHAFDGFCYYLI